MVRNSTNNVINKKSNNNINKMFSNLSSPRECFFGRRTVFKSILVGMIGAVATYVTGSLEATIMLAMVMPGVYWGFAFMASGWIEVIQETITTQLLILFYLFCMKNVSSSSSSSSSISSTSETTATDVEEDVTPMVAGIPYYYWAPISVGIHGIIDLLHHFHLYPSEHHVRTCCPNYPLLCASVDISLCITLSALLYVFGPF